MTQFISDPSNDGDDDEDLPKGFLTTANCALALITFCLVPLVAGGATRVWYELFMFFWRL